MQPASVGKTVWKHLTEGSLPCLPASVCATLKWWFLCVCMCGLCVVCVCVCGLCVVCVCGVCVVCVCMCVYVYVVCVWCVCTQKHVFMCAYTQMKKVNVCVCSCKFSNAGYMDGYECACRQTHVNVCVKQTHVNVCVNVNTCECVCVNVNM